MTEIILSTLVCLFILKSMVKDLEQKEEKHETLDLSPIPVHKYEGKAFEELGDFLNGLDDRIDGIKKKYEERIDQITKEHQNRIDEIKRSMEV